MITLVAVAIWLSTLAVSVLYVRYASLLSKSLKQGHPEILNNRNVVLRQEGSYAAPVLWAILFKTHLFEEDTSRLLVPARALAAASFVGIVASIIIVGVLLPG